MLHELTLGGRPKSSKCTLLSSFCLRMAATWVQRGMVHAAGGQTSGLSLTCGRQLIANFACSGR